MRISHACASQGDRLFGAWGDWAAQTHHGQGENAHRSSKDQVVAHMRQEHQPQDPLLYCRSGDARLAISELPDEIRELSDSAGFRVKQFGNAVGMDHEDFLGLDDYPPEDEIREAQRTRSRSSRCNQRSFSGSKQNSMNLKKSQSIQTLTSRGTTFRQSPRRKGTMAKTSLLS